MGPTNVRTLVVCIGNSLVADDALGFEVFERLQQIPLSDHIRLAYLGVGGIALMDELQGEERLIVVDAVQLGVQPGEICQLEWDELPPVDGSPVSAHGIGLREAIELGRLLEPGRMPKEIIFIGVEGVCFDACGVGLSPPVQQAVNDVVQKVITLAGHFTSEEPHFWGPKQKCFLQNEKKNFCVD